MSANDESTIVTIYDRRVTVERLPPSHSAYALARAWLHSHPDRLSSAEVCRRPDSRLRLPPLPPMTAAQQRAHQPLQSLPVPRGQEVYLAQQKAVLPPSARPEMADDEEGDEEGEGEDENEEGGEGEDAEGSQDGRAPSEVGDAVSQAGGEGEGGGAAGGGE